MSTFNGIIAQFPAIRVDYFRRHPTHKAPLACFLSHVHSDHLTGLESLRAPFVYCSPATREILLRLERYHYRINFARGILESRNVTYDKSMHRLAKPLPLDTPTVIELAPGSRIRVTLIDANHCIGAVMFLFEDDAHAVLYTGDIRAETWWVNSLVQNPVLLPYSLGLRHLDCIYLDTTFAGKSDPYRQFPSKAEGIRELLQEVQQYPSDTVFYFHSWTFGYENVWVALSAFLHSQIHLDDYRARLYSSLSLLDKKHLRETGLNVQSDNRQLRNSGLDIREAPALCGFRNGNHTQPGCLTSQEHVRLHSCERGMGCSVVDQDTNAGIVHIIPIVSRANGTEIAEIGAGGGKGDLDQREELDTGDVTQVGKLMELCANSIKDEEVLSKVLARLQKTLEPGQGKINLGLCLQKDSQDSEDDLTLQTLVSVLKSQASRSREERPNRTIRFPYSRHSSYSELCKFLDAFKPRDVYPCTVDQGSWTPGLSMQSLFGEYCSGSVFRHDLEMMEAYESRPRCSDNKRHHDQSPEIQHSQEVDGDPSLPAKRAKEAVEASSSKIDAASGTSYLTKPLDDSPAVETTNTPFPAERSSTPHHHERANPSSMSEASSPHPRSLRATLGSRSSARPASYTDNEIENDDDDDNDHVASPESPSLPPTTPSLDTGADTGSGRHTRRLKNKTLAYNAALGIGLTWAEFGGLVSARRGEGDVEL